MPDGSAVMAIITPWIADLSQAGRTVPPLPGNSVPKRWLAKRIAAICASTKTRSAGVMGDCSMLMTPAPMTSPSEMMALCASALVDAEHRS